MSQATETPTTAPMTDEEFLNKMAAAREILPKKAARSGPCYSPNGSVAIIYDQVFGRGITPAGAVECPTPLACGSTGQALQVALVASHVNEAAFSMPAGASIAVSFLEGESPEGEFAAAGPVLTITAPTGGIEADPDCPLIRLPIPDGLRPWLKVKLTFTGTFTGGKLDCVLAMAAR